MRRLIGVLAAAVIVVLGFAPSASAATAKTLPYRWEHQSTYYYCGPASTRIALSARMDAASDPSQDTLASYMGTDVNGTDDIGNVVGAMNHFANTGWYEAKYITDPPASGQEALLKQDLVFDVDRGYAMVANVVSGWRPPFYPGGTIYHYVAVVGYQDGGDTAVIADPAGTTDPQPGSGSWANVPSTYTVSTHDLAVWIGSKGYAA